LPLLKFQPSYIPPICGFI